MREMISPGAQTSYCLILCGFLVHSTVELLSGVLPLIYVVQVGKFCFFLDDKLTITVNS
jgi:hypothetical protein